MASEAEDVGRSKGRPTPYEEAMAIARRVAAERDQRFAQLRAAEAERDRYRKALAEIVALPRPQFQEERTWREVALEALRDG